MHLWNLKNQVLKQMAKAIDKTGRASYNKLDNAQMAELADAPHLKRGVK